jgi:hypothetical protein
MWPRVARHFITALLVVSLDLGPHFGTELLSESYLVSLMYLLLTLTHYVTLLRFHHSVFLDPSAPDAKTRGQELFVGASKQDMLTKFRVSRVKGNR